MDNTKPSSPRDYFNFLVGVKPKPQQVSLPPAVQGLPQVAPPPQPAVPMRRKPDWGKG